MPFAVHVEGLTADRAGRRRAFDSGLLLGSVFFAGHLYWMPIALAGVTVLAIPAYLATVAVLALVIGGVGWALHRLRRGAGFPLWLALPLAWTTGEWIRAHLPGSLAFPWTGLGTSLAGFPKVAGIAELVGARGVGFWLALVSGVAAVLLLRVRSGRRWGSVGAILILVAGAPAGWGVWRAETLELREVARVALVQPEASREDRRDPERALEAARRVSATLDGGASAGALDLVVWPETAFPVRLGAAEGEESVAFLRELSRRVWAPSLAGAYEAAGPGDARHNAALLVDAGGIGDFVYRKRFLVPIVERTPLVAPPGAPDGLGGLVPGTAAPLGILADGTSFGVLVCYESAFARVARGYADDGADFLVNITNDSWFGGEEWYARTTGLWQHPAHLVMRAIETRRGVVRAANGGFSHFVDPIGRPYAGLPPFEPGASVAPVRTTEVRTLHTRIGDAVPIAALVLTLGGVLFAGGGRPRGPPDSPGTPPG